MVVLTVSLVEEVVTLHIIVFVLIGELTEVENIAALKCMASFLLPKRRKQGDKDIYATIPLLIDIPIC